MPGTFVFRPIEANLTHDTDWLGNMDPYCAYMMNGKRVKGQVCKSGGQHPIWNEATTVPMEIDQPACVVELMDKDTLIDDSIGTFVVDLNEVRNNGSVSKWYPVIHKNKPAGQILFEAAYQPPVTFVQKVEPVLVQKVEPVLVEPVLVQEVPKTAIIEETVLTKEVLPQETYTQSTFISKGGVIPTGSQNLDGGLYGKVVHAEPVSHLPNQLSSGTNLHQETLPTTNLGGPLSGSLGGGVLGSRELTGQELIGGRNYIQSTTSQFTSQQHPSAQYGGSNLGGTHLGGNLPGSNLGGIHTENLGNQYVPQQGLNLPINYNAAQLSNAQLGGLYQTTTDHPAHNLVGSKTKSNQKGNIVPGDLVGGHTQTNKNIGDQPL